MLNININFNGYYTSLVYVINVMGSKTPAARNLQEILKYHTQTSTLGTLNTR